MTLQHFLKVTAGVPVPRLRQAMAAALMVEPARTTPGYRRFYRRVLDVLATTGDLQVPAAPPAGETPGRSVAVATRRGTTGRRRLSTARLSAARP